MSDLTHLRLGSLVTHIITRDGTRYTLGNTSEQAQIGPSVWTWTDVARQGLKMLSYLNAPTNRTLSFTTQLGGHGINVESVLRSFDRLAAAGQIVRLVNASTAEQHMWYRIISCPYTITARSETQHAKAATVTWSLQEAVLDNSPTIGRTKVAPVASTAARRYTVKAGDTIYSIAQYQLGDGTRWPEIASLNHLGGQGGSTFNEQVPGQAAGGVTVTAGQVLKIPAR